ncbi:addiction module antidote protein, HigA family [Mangrovimicrobium sediminis]|uniref:Addiction module antidote protein, HigA family n=1 Tax=Mangrovimicrobium sediminis TaxID=2562682 RepID=A0A4Z0M5N1_9GAMM|nr:HigA family addiction module antitoxin [Haliea sp. SAOS-164]TGD74605.1 addiction module antidote protein, HigA family [Haliea sp. SAOS-164]
MSKPAAVAHPGGLLESLVLAPSGLSQSQLARHLGFNQPQPVNELVKGKRNITPKMALLLERLTASAYPAEFWLLAQLRWDLGQARDSVSPSRINLVQALELPEADTLPLEDLAAQLRGMG